MARTRDQEPEEDEQMEDEELVDLQFNETLTWRAGKPIATSELLRRLEKLSKELVDMEQDTVNKESLHDVSKQLASHNLLAHKEAGVKAYTASCLVDILKLCAPDAPFTPSQLKEIFNLFIKVVLPALWDPTHPYNKQHKYVLMSLADVKSILLVNDLPNAEDLLLFLFSSVFDGISGAAKSTSGEQVAKDVEYHMTEILVTLVDEGQGLPPTVLDVIMAQFLRAAPPGGAKNKSELNGNQTTLLPKQEPEAYVVAKTICNSCQDKMARYVSQYFSDVIMDVTTGKPATNGNDDEGGSEDDEPAGPSEADFRELRKAHLLLRELWRAAPTVLQNVVPQIDAELSADNIQLRLLATETLGDMISGIGAAGPPPAPALDPAAYPPLGLDDDGPEHPELSILNTPISPLSFTQTHPQAFHNFTGRRNDKSPLIRAAWTTAAGYIVSTSAGGIGLSREDESTFLNGLRDRLNDNDEKVRLAAVRSIEVFNFRDIVMKLGSSGGVDKPESLLSTLTDRCRDKRPAIRVEAMALIGKLWAVATGELMAGNDIANVLSSVPTYVLNAFYANDPELNLLLERVIFDCLVPLSYPPAKGKGSKANGNSQSQAQSQLADQAYDPDKIRAERILLLVKCMSDKARRAFFAIQTRQPQFALVVENYVRQCEAWNGGTPERNAEMTKQNLKKTIHYICSFFPDQPKVETDLYNFASLNDRRSYQLIKFVISLESDFKTMYRAIKEFNKRVQGSTKPQILDTMVPLLYRSAYIMFNKSHLSTFIECSKNDKNGLGPAAQQITNEISQHLPDLFKTHIGELCKDLIESAPTATKENDVSVVETLKACSSYSRKYPENLPEDRKFTQALTNYALYGRPPKAAKYAVNILMARKNDKSMVAATDLLGRITKDWGPGKPHFLNKLAAVSQLELLAPKVAADANDQIMDMVLQNVLQKVRTEAAESDPEWVSDSDMDEECQEKCYAVKVIVNRLRGIQEPSEAKDVTLMTFKLLRTLTKRDGDLCKTADTPAHHRSRLRLLAGQSVLKLCTAKQFEELFSHSEFNRLSILTQDQCAEVRRGFITKLQKYLVNGKLRPRFYTMIFLTAFEPSTEFRQQIETWIRSRARHFQENKQTVMEATMGRLVSLLAHHPDYNCDANDLMDHARYLVYYLSNVSTEQNFGMIFKYAERVKQTRDGINAAESEKLYVVSDLTTAVLRKWQERRNWSFQAYAGKVGLPVGLYAALPDHDTAQKIAEKQYLPEGTDERLDELLRSLDKKKVRRSQLPPHNPFLQFVLRVDIIGPQKRKGIDERGDGNQSAKKTKLTQSRTPRSKSTKSARTSTTKRSAAKAKSSGRSRKAASSSSPGPESGERRRSGRSKANSSYIERDSDQDDEDMLEGVSKWEYYDKTGNKVGGDDNSESESTLTEVEEEGTEPEPMEEDGEDDQAEADSKASGKDAAEDSDLSEPPAEDPEDGAEQVEPEVEAEDEAGDEAEAEDAEEEVEEEEEEPQPQPRASARKGRSAASAKSKTPPAKPAKPATKAAAAKGKSAAASKAKPQPVASGRATRSRRAAADDAE
ncbi:smad nuclear-interacting protein 1 [Apiospora aurea]|uniref:Smad nuclear-interacting protein 1 n=1 Tax=Apiospora aurea TaxID=335848 RepID=A0ABR1QG88_9PEZI